MTAIALPGLKVKKKRRKPRRPTPDEIFAFIWLGGCVLFTIVDILFYITVDDRTFAVFFLICAAVNLMSGFGGSRSAWRHPRYGVKQYLDDMWKDDE